MSVHDLYRDTVLAHNRAPRRFGALAAPTHTADGENALCGDHLHCEVQLIDGRIADLRFSGEACAIAIASASMLGDLVTTQDAVFVRDLRDRFVEWLCDTDAAPIETLGELNALAELKRYPSRHVCALLSFATLEAALRGEAHTSSQSNPPESAAR